MSRCGAGPNLSTTSVAPHGSYAQTVFLLANHQHARQSWATRRSQGRTAFSPTAALQQPASSGTAQPWRHVLLEGSPRQQTAHQPRASAAPVADYAPSPTDAEVLKLPIKQELKPEQMINVFGYPRDLRRR
jgi:hypothetical protein